MKNRGFTLVELLGVIVILGVIGTLITPLIINLLNDGKDDVNDMQVLAIKRASKNYVTANLYSLPDCEDSCVIKEITVGDLKSGGYLEDKDLKDARTDEYVSDSAKIRILKENGKYKYEYPVE